MHRGTNYKRFSYPDGGSLIVNEDDIVSFGAAPYSGTYSGLYGDHMAKRNTNNCNDSGPTDDFMDEIFLSVQRCAQTSMIEALIEYTSIWKCFRVINADGVKWQDAKKCYSQRSLCMTVYAADAMKMCQICFQGGDHLGQSYLFNKTLCRTCHMNRKWQNCYDGALVHVAAANGNLPILRKLIQHKEFDVNMLDGHRQTALHCTARTGQLEAAQLLIQAKISVNARRDRKHGRERQLDFRRPPDGFTALSLAVLRKDTKMIALLIANGADVSIAMESNRDSKGIIQYLAEANEVGTLELLFKNGATFLPKPPEKSSARPIPPDVYHPPTWRARLAKIGLDSTGQNKRTNTAEPEVCGLGAQENLEVDNVKRHKGPSLDTKLVEMMTSIVVDAGAFDAAKYLFGVLGLDAEEELLLKNRLLFNSALRFDLLPPRGKDFAPVIKFLIENGADVCFTSVINSGNTPLHIAHSRMVPMLIAACHVKNDAGLDALYYAIAEQSHQKIFALICAEGATFATRELCLGRNCLHLSLQRTDKSLEIVKLMIVSCTSPMFAQLDPDGLTPLELAKKINFTEASAALCSEMYTIETLHVKRQDATQSPIPRYFSRTVRELMYGKVSAALQDTKDGEEIEEECPMCYEKYIAGIDSVMRLACGHEFHERCLLSWLATGNTCPYCRANVMKKV